MVGDCRTRSGTPWGTLTLFELLSEIDAGSFLPIPVAGSPIHYQEVWVVTRLAHANLLSASREIDAWFKRIADEPERFHFLLNGCEAEEVTKAIDESVDLRMDGAPGEDGDFAAYLFCFLKALQAIFQEAWESESEIGYVRCTYVYRTFAAA